MESNSLYPPRSRRTIHSVRLPGAVLGVLPPEPAVVAEPRVGEQLPGQGLRRVPADLVVLGEVAHDVDAGLVDPVLEPEQRLDDLLVQPGRPRLARDAVQQVEQPERLKVGAVPPRADQIEGVGQPLGAYRRPVRAHHAQCHRGQLGGGRAVPGGGVLQDLRPPVLRRALRRPAPVPGEHGHGEVAVDRGLRLVDRHPDPQHVPALPERHLPGADDQRGGSGPEVHGERPLDRNHVADRVGRADQFAAEEHHGRLGGGDPQAAPFGLVHLEQHPGQRGPVLGHRREAAPVDEPVLLGVDAFPAPVVPGPGDVLELDRVAGRLGGQRVGGEQPSLERDHVGAVGEHPAPQRPPGAAVRVDVVLQVGHRSRPGPGDQPIPDGAAPVQPVDGPIGHG